MLCECCDAILVLCGAAAVLYGAVPILCDAVRGAYGGARGSRGATVELRLSVIITVVLILARHHTLLPARGRL
jgi:hypothetical protein